MDYFDGIAAVTFGEPISCCCNFVGPIAILVDLNSYVH